MTKKELQYYTSLNLKKFREQEALFLVEGKRIVEDGINSHFQAEIIFVTDKFCENNSEFCDYLESLKVKIEKIDDRSFKKITYTKNPQGIAAVFHKEYTEIDNFGAKNFIVALENISDPGNMGTILRTCAWFGFDEIIISPDSVDLYNPKVLRSSMGAVFKLKIKQTEDFYSVLGEFKDKGFSLINTTTNGENIFDQKFNNKILIVFCNEANGASLQLSAICDKNLSIPKIGSGESLNVATAAAVILSQISNTTVTLPHEN